MPREQEMSTFEVSPSRACGLLAILLMLGGCGDDQQPSSTTPAITSFRLASLGDGTIDQAARTITFATHAWIDDLDALAPAFSASGEVTVDDVPQTSGVTAHDFYRDVIYTVANDEGARAYTVHVEAPQTTGLPIIRVDTRDGQAITSKQDYLDANVRIVDPDHPENNVEDLDYEDRIRGRGNSTWNYPKKPYRLKLDKKTSLFGLTAAKSWVLLANYQDPTLMLNAVTFEMGQRFGLPFTGHAEHVELFLNGEYQGNYVLTEQVQVGKGRVDVDEDDGFLVELDVYYDEDPKFTTQHYHLPVMIKSPEDLDDEHGYDFVKDALNGLEAAMVDASFPNSGYRDLVQMTTLADFLLINELVRNTELVWPKSTYLYRDAEGGIGFGPLWDFDWAFGYSGHGHQYFDTAEGALQLHGFFQRFFDDPQFVATYKARWAELRDQIVSMPDYIDALAARLQRSQAQNFWKWPEAGNAGFEQEIQDLRQWWLDRVDFMDGEVAALN